MTIRRLLWSLLAMALVVGAAGAAALVRPGQILTGQVFEPRTTANLVCVPAASGSLRLFGDAEATPLSGEGSPDSGPVLAEGEAVAGGFVSGAGAATEWVPCAQARSESVLVVADPAHTSLTLTNPDTTAASIDLTLLGPDGEVTALGARGIAVAARGTRSVALSVLASGVTGPVGVIATATTGRAHVLASTAGNAQLSAAVGDVPVTSAVLPGIAAGATRATVLLANPGDDPATVDLTALGANAPFVPAGGEGVEVPPRSAMSVEVGTALAGELAAIAVEADHPIAARLVVGTEPALVEPAAAASAVRAVVPEAGTVQVTASGDVDARVTFTVAGETPVELTVPAGTTLALPLGAGTEGRLVTVTASTPVVAVAVTSGLVIPFAPSESAPAARATLRLDPTLD